MPSRKSADPGTWKTLFRLGPSPIQGRGAWLVTGFEGSKTNIIGLPVDETLELLARAGYHVGACPT